MNTYYDPEDGDPTALAQLETNAAIMDMSDPAVQDMLEQDKQEALARIRND